MRFEEQNPVWKTFNHLLGDDPRYPGKWVDVFWNTDEQGRARDVEVAFIPREEVASHEKAEELWARFAAYNRRWGGDLGNSVAEWMEPGGYTPATIFGSMLDRGFVNRDEMKNALKEFAHIRECDWARQMLWSVEREDSED